MSRCSGDNSTIEGAVGGAAGAVGGAAGTSTGTGILLIGFTLEAGGRGGDGGGESKISIIFTSCFGFAHRTLGTDFLVKAEIEWLVC